MTPLVSIIIPTYKGHEHIARAIESVLHQTYENLEIIVVDDNGLGSESQIKTEKILKQYASDPRLSYIVHEENKNGSAARNTGIRASHGEYLCFLDDDDELTNKKTSIQVEKFSELPDSYGMVYGAVDEIIDEARVRHCKAQFEGDFLFAFLHGDVIACSSTVMITRVAMDATGEWDESFKRHQDWEFFARVANAFDVAYIPQVCVRKYKYDNNLPKDGITTEKYREHFLNKMNHIIDSFDDKRKNMIYDHHYVDVGKVYLKNKDLKNAIRLAKKTKNKVNTYRLYFVDGLAFVLRKAGMRN